MAGKPHKGSWGDRYIIEPRPNKSRITCNFCVNYCSDGSCMAQPIVVSEVGYDYWKQCSKFSLAEEYDDEEKRRQVNRVKKLQSPYYSERITAKIKTKNRRDTQVKRSQAKIHRIGVGSKVGLYDYTCKQNVIYHLVQPGEADILHDRISVTTPLGKALLNRCTDDIVKVDTLNGEEKYLVLWCK